MLLFFHRSRCWRAEESAQFQPPEEPKDLDDVRPSDVAEAVYDQAGAEFRDHEEMALKRQSPVQVEGGEDIKDEPTPSATIVEPQQDALTAESDAIQDITMTVDTEAITRMMENLQQVSAGAEEPALITSTTSTMPTTVPQTSALPTAQTTAAPAPETVPPPASRSSPPAERRPSETDNAAAAAVVDPSVQLVGGEDVKHEQAGQFFQLPCCPLRFFPLQGGQASDHAHSSAASSASGDTFSFADYDIIGMDLDCTLTRFNTEGLMKNVYLGLMRYLVNVKEYDKVLVTDKEYGWDEGKNFLQRGLVLDAQKGNVVKLDAEGNVMKAAHGKTFLSSDDLKKTYGDERSTAIFKDYAKTFREVAGTIYCVQDIFILPALLANANLVQLQDKLKTAGKDGKDTSKVSGGNYKTWADVFAGLLELYRRERFADKTGEFFSAILVDTKTYVKPTSDKFKEFMKQLRKEKKILYLLTGSNFDYTNFLCEFSIGKDWKDYFDTVICHAGKPGFFTGIRPFYVSGRNVEITDPLNHLAKGEVYMMGNWRDLYAWFTKQLEKKEAKAVYIGDNMVLDIISAAKFTNCKAIAIMEELDPNFGTGSNAKWGSIFADKTLWATMLRRYSLIAVPTIEYLAENPIDHKYKIFTEKQDGFHPATSAMGTVPK
ncbi:unnamed protein product [Cyprideis torosa]|uniref:Uncharacterized protein n=1 Tax=Cyprideis torosa TaxID=163714 RepID=A0A7R8W9J1_9CRUS|nr:unnamed protein product [Cyprideis torosa]CAG0884924.1 unnamed protein product [Cyprideis torosa]